MADSEFEEFRQIFESLPQHLKASAQTYTLVHDVLSDEETNEAKLKNINTDSIDAFNVFSTSDDDNRDPQKKPTIQLRYERKRRKLPELPKNKRSVLSLADELSDVFSTSDRRKSLVTGFRDSECRSPDSGISIVHSPERAKSSSPQQIDTPASSCCSSGLPFPNLELLEATHRGLYKFIPRHRDEMEVDVGDPIYVQKEAEDCWCEGVNLRTGAHGAFPSAYAVDVDYTDFESTTPKAKRERYLLGYMGSMETKWHKGNSVLCQTIKKITEMPNCKPQQCILEVSDLGLRMVDRAKSAAHSRGSSTPFPDYFYSLKNVSFCAFYPEDQRYMGFVTKHPTCQRFACHVFKANESSRPVAEAIGRAFERFYQKYIETAYPVEDIYIE